MEGTRIGKTRGQRLASVTLFCTLACLVLGVDRLDGQEATEDQSVIPWSNASEYIGEKVTIEGEIVATHSSPLSTLLSFDQTFSKVTAIIHPADRGAFPPEPEKYYRDKKVQITGMVVEYENKARIVLKSRDQIRIVEPKAPPAPAPAKDDETSELALELIERLIAIESRLEGLGGQLDLIITALEQLRQPEPPAVELLPGQIPPSEPPPRPRSQALRSIKRGMRASQVEKLIGPPAYIDTTSEGTEVWYYGGGRTVTFNPRGRLEAMTGFQRR